MVVGFITTNALGNISKQVSIHRNKQDIKTFFP
jgi:hypothetical protein